MKGVKVRDVLAAHKETVLQCCGRLMLPQHFTAFVFPYVHRPHFEAESFEQLLGRGGGAEKFFVEISGHIQSVSR